MNMAPLASLAFFLLFPLSISASWWQHPSAPRRLALERSSSSLHASIRATTPEYSDGQTTPSSLGLDEERLHALGLDTRPTTIWPTSALDSRDQDSVLALDGHLKPQHLHAQATTASSSYMDGFDLEKSKLFARLVSASYCSNTTVIQAWQCTRCQRVPGFKVHTVVYDIAWSLLAYVGYLPELDAIVAVFRGSDNHNWSNWFENLRSWQHQRMWPLPGAPDKARVHAGFYNMWALSQMRTNMTAAIQELVVVHPTASLYVTGHSMGAALAQLCALDAKVKFNIAHVHAYTFGSPRVGNAAFQQLFEQEVDSSWRFTHNRDIVPSLPPTLIGYHHMAREVWTLDVQAEDTSQPPQLQLLMCDSTGEDPSCHNGACRLGLCTSVMDHLKYLQYEMYHKEAEC